MNGEVKTPFPPAIQHLSNLDSVASELWELPEATRVEPDFTLQIPQEPLAEDSDVDLRMGKIKDHAPWTEPLTFTYRDRSVLEDHQKFAAEVCGRSRKSGIATRWRTTRLFYQEYFLDQQKISDVRSKGQAKIQHFNVKVTR